MREGQQTDYGAEAVTFYRRDRDALRDLVMNFGLITRFKGELPAELTNAQYRSAIAAFVDFDSEASWLGGLNKTELRQLAETLDVPHEIGRTTDDLRAVIASACGFTYDRSRSTQQFKKQELQRIALELAEREYKQTGRRVTSDDDEAKPDGREDETIGCDWQTQVTVEVENDDGLGDGPRQLNHLLGLLSALLVYYTIISSVAVGFVFGPQSVLFAGNGVASIGLILLFTAVRARFLGGTIPNEVSEQ